MRENIHINLKKINEPRMHPKDAILLEKTMSIKTDSFVFRLFSVLLAIACMVSGDMPVTGD